MNLSRVFRTLGAIVLFAAVSGCATTPKFVAPEIPPLDPALRPDDSTCVAADESRCALDSPFYAFADTLAHGGKHAVSLLEIGEEALAARIHLIRSARASIVLQTYIWAEDEAGTLMMGELLAAARRGVRVRVIADQLYSGGDANTLAHLALAHRNLDLRLYNPLGQKATASLMDKVRGVFTNFGVLNHRMHNKLMVVDGKFAITGGRNIENKYFDYDPDFNFIDRDVLVIGPVVAEMSRVFDTYWGDPIVVDISRLNDVHGELERMGYRVPVLVDIATPPLFMPLINASIDPSYIRSKFIDTAFTIDKVRYSADRPQKPFIKNEAATKISATHCVR